VIDDDAIDELAHRLRRSTSGAVVLTGAGVSVASGVPSFRGEGGLWERYDPAEHATIEALRRDPARVWQFLRDLDAVLAAAVPNAAHRALADLERRGLIANIVTQNIDALHQAAGSHRVIELHGSHQRLMCIACARRFARDEVVDPGPGEVPVCPACGGLVKPDVTFFGELLPAGAFQRADHAVRSADLLLVVGTSVEVAPASRLPQLARHGGADVWEINPEPELDGARTIAAPAELVLPRLAARVHPRGLAHWRSLLRGVDPRTWLGS
jgi:NAD-dependent deacetylase